MTDTWTCYEHAQHGNAGDGGCTGCREEKEAMTAAAEIRKRLEDSDRIIALKDARILELEGTIDQLNQRLGNR